MNYRRYYVPNSLVFITIVTYNRQEFLLNYIDLIKQSFSYAKSKFEFKIESIVILKDHLHFILNLENIHNYPNIIRYFKTYFSRNVNIENNYLTVGKKLKREKGIWQSRYWAHIILDEYDLNKHIDYIHYNSYKHYNIAPKDWQYSTFINYVKNGYYDINWCNVENKHKILELDFE